MGTSFDGFAGFDDELEAFADDVADAQEDVDEAIDRGVGRGTRAIGNDAQRRALVDTGELRDSKRVRRLGSRRWELSFTADHAAPTEYGSGPHLITPNDADALRFEADGEEVFTQRVEHPGTSPNQFLRPALRAGRDELTDAIAAELRRTFRRAFS